MFGQSSSAAGTPTAEPVPVIDGGVGPCSLDLMLTAADGKPAGAATVKVHIAYGFGGFRRLDLEAGANSDGQVKFTGLPSRVRHPPLEFRASKGDLLGTAQFDPAMTCHDTKKVKLSQMKPSSDQP